MTLRELQLSHVTQRYPAKSLDTARFESCDKPSGACGAQAEPLLGDCGLVPDVQDFPLVLGSFALRGPLVCQVQHGLKPFHFLSCCDRVAVTFTNFDTTMI